MDEMWQGRVIRKVAWRIIPLLGLLHALNWVDRVNVGFAALTMNKSIGLSPAQYGFGAGIFIVGYVAFQIPSNVMLERVGARIWIPFIVVVWGFFSGAMAFIHKPIEFYIVRFFVGAAEAGFFPGAVLYISYWFPVRRVAQMNALLTACGSVGVVFGSPVSGALLGVHGFMGLESWRLMFVMEALPAVLMGAASFFLMTSRPEEAPWLTADERSWLSKATKAAEAATAGANIPSEGRQGIVNARVLLISLIYFGSATALFVAGVWAPLMIRELGFSPLQIGFLNSIPACISLIAGVLYAWHSDRTGERTWHVVIACLLGAIGFALGGFITSVLGVIVAFTLMNFGSNSPKPPLWSLTSAYLSGRARATGIATINSVGHIGAFLGPYLFGVVKGATGSFRGGLYCIAASLVLSATLMLVMAHLQPVRSSVARAATQP